MNQQKPSRFTRHSLARQCRLRACEFFPAPPVLGPCVFGLAPPVSERHTSDMTEDEEVILEEGALDNLREAAQRTRDVSNQVSSLGACAGTITTMTSPTAPLPCWRLRRQWGRRPGGSWGVVAVPFGSPSRQRCSRGLGKGRCLEGASEDHLWPRGAATAFYKPFSQAMASWAFER